MSTKVFFLLFIYLSVLHQALAQPADTTNHHLSLSGSAALTLFSYEGQHKTRRDIVSMHMMQGF